MEVGLSVRPQLALASGYPAAAPFPGYNIIAAAQSAAMQRFATSEPALRFQASGHIPIRMSDVQGMLARTMSEGLE